MLAMEKPQISIDTYHEYMVEAFDALNAGFSHLAKAREREVDDHVSDWLFVRAGMQCRYAFLLGANALEAAANALLRGLNRSPSSYIDLEKLPTLLKFEIFCLAHGAELDRGNVLYARIKEVVRCRNEFVHPKPRKVSGDLTDDNEDVELQISKTKTRQYPMYFSMFEPKHACNAIGDILAFVAWVVFDLCSFEPAEGALLIGYNSYGGTAKVSNIGAEYGFDLRTFNMLGV